MFVNPPVIKRTVEPVVRRLKALLRLKPPPSISEVHGVKGPPLEGMVIQPITPAPLLVSMPVPEPSVLVVMGVLSNGWAAAAKGRKQASI